jgi:hypothetical protein
MKASISAGQPASAGLQAMAEGGDLCGLVAELTAMGATLEENPAGGGEGFNAGRDDEADRVSMHSGIVSQDDGLGSSDLGEQHRLDKPVAMIRIVRTN